MCGHSGLIGLVLRGLNLGLQVGRRVEVLALLARAAALDVVHADGDRVVAGVDRSQNRHSFPLSAPFQRALKITNFSLVGPPY